MLLFIAVLTFIQNNNNTLMKTYEWCVATVINTECVNFLFQHNAMFLLPTSTHGIVNMTVVAVKSYIKSQHHR